MTVNSAHTFGLRAWLASPRGVSIWALVRNVLIAAFAFFLTYSILASIGAAGAESTWGGMFAVALVGAALILFRFRPATSKSTAQDKFAFHEAESESPHHLINGAGGSGKVVMDLRAAPAADIAAETIVTGEVGHGKTATADDAAISPARLGKPPAAAGAIKDAAENAAIVVDGPAPSPEVIEKLEAGPAGSTEARTGNPAAAKSATAPKAPAKTPARKPATKTTTAARKPRATPASAAKRPSTPRKPSTPKPAPEKPTE